MRTISMKEINNELYIGKYKLSDLAREYKTPLYVFDELHLRSKLDTFKTYFKSNKFECKTIYASKAFYAPYLANIINEYNFGLDSVSYGDLYMIKHANFPFSDVVLHGNNKSKDEIIYAIKNKVGFLVVDNLEEMQFLDEITKELKLSVTLLLRVNPGIEAHTHEYIQTSTLNSKFGESIFDKEKIKKIVSIANNNEYLNFRGFHCHIGSSVCEAKSFKDSAKVMLDFVSEMQMETNTLFDTLNLGGGFGIKYLETDHEINLKEMLTCIVKTVEEYCDNSDLKIKKLLIEPGRSIVGDSCFTLYTAGITKQTYGKKNYLFLDGGMTDNIRPALYQAKYTIENASNVNGEKVLVDCVGPCCESGDIIAKDVMVSSANKGDTIVSYCTGAYCYSMSSNYNGSVHPATIFVKGDNIHTAIRRQDFNDLCSDYPLSDSVKTHKIFDMHSDMLYDLWTKKCRGVKDEFTDYHVEQLHNSVIHGAIWTMYSEFDFDLIEACKIALGEIKMDKLSDFNIVLGLEGLRNLKRPEDIDILYNMGFRHAMLTWNEENRYATGAKADPTHGLKEDGVKVLKRMEELGMIIDLAHTNEKTFYDILKVAHKNIIYSHGNCKAYCGHVRNVTDDQMRALKAVDGLLGLTLADNFIREKEDERTFENYLKHIKHAIDIMGVDNVGFGFDFMDYLTEFPNSNLVDVKDATFAYRIIEGLKQIGLNDEEIDKVCYYNFYNRFKDKIMLRGTKND